MKGDNKQIWSGWRALQRIKGHCTRWLQERHYMPGTIIKGRYRVIHLLGSGSYGVTYRCRDLNEQDQLVVIKRIHPLRGGAERARLIYERECKAMRALNHPNIPAWRDQFLYQGQPCLVMSYMEGRSLGELLFERDMVFSEAASIRLMLQLVELMELIHAQNMVHRDISLSNVLLHQGQVQLIDFGLTWHRNEPKELVRQLDELVSGDEQEKHIRRSLNVNSDFYGMGHLLLYLLYSSFDEEQASNRQSSHVSQPGEQQSEQQAIRGWENELELHPATHAMLRRMLQTDRPYTHVAEVRSALENIAAQLLAESDDGGSL